MTTRARPRPPGGAGGAGGATGETDVAAGQDPIDPRTLVITAVGQRWSGVDLTRLLAEESETTVPSA